MNARPAAASLAILLLSACGQDRPLPTFDVVVYGDCRHNDDVHREIVATIARTKPKAILVTGDLVDHADEEPLWNTYREIEKDLRANSLYLCATGDHDQAPKKLFLKEMGRESLYYDVRLGDLHVFILDSTNFFRDPDQIAFLEKTAAASDAPHKVAVFHHPVFVIDKDRSPQADAIRPNIHPILVKHRFCAVFNGHSHAFYATVRDRVRYVITGGGGAPLHSAPGLELPGDLSRRFYHFVGLTVTPKGIGARVIGHRGKEAVDLAFQVCTHP